MTLADRPDLRKAEIVNNISFRDAKKLLYKFLFLCNLPFEPDVKLSYKTMLDIKQGNSSLVLGQIPLNNLNSYVVTAQLNSFRVNGDPVYIIMVPTLFGLLSNRHLAKIKILQQHYNIIVFDQADLETVGVNISEDNFIKPLNKESLKKWVNILFSKISDLEGIVTSTTSYGKVIKYIDKPFSNHQNPRVRYLNRKNKNLEKKLLSSNLPVGKYCNESKLLSEFVNVPKKTRVWWFTLIQKIRNSGSKEKALTILNNTKYDIEKLSHGFYKVVDPKTFDYLVISLHNTKVHDLPHRVRRSPSLTGIVINVFLDTTYFSYKISRYSKKKVLGYIETSNLDYLIQE